MKTCVVVMLVVGLVAGIAATAAAQESQAWIPGLASFLVPGLGQLLNDQVDKALLHFGIDLGILAIGWYVAALLPFGYASYALVPAAHLAWGVYSGYDAYTVAKDKGFTIGFVPNGIAFSYRF